MEKQYILSEELQGEATRVAKNTQHSFLNKTEIGTHVGFNEYCMLKAALIYGI